MSHFTIEELHLIVKHCDMIEEEYGRTRTKQERLLSYQIALKVNKLLGDKAIYLGLMKMNLEDIIDSQKSESN
ncbi:hypothetical protein [Paenibacillus elgii]|uniref:hypothetical protein n=1 Tax=Paenibacillus elgii TaxID=189691 RepID=UPI0030DBB77A